MRTCVQCRLYVHRSYEEDSRMELTNQSGRHFHASSNRASTKPARDHSSEIREARKQVSEIKSPGNNCK